MKRLAAAVVAITVAGAGTLAVTATGRDSGPPLGRLTVTVDLPPSPASLGANRADTAGSPDAPPQIADVFAGNGRVLQNGHQVGTFHFDNVVAQASPPVTIITGIIGLAHGSVLTEGTADLSSDAPSEAAVIGGTGVYAGARGTVTVSAIPNTDRRRVVITFMH
jgi:hypothetical protein